MTNEELLIDRYKVIAPWPGCHWQVGDVFYYADHHCFMTESQPSISIHESDLESHPHLFKPLQWWEERKPEEMPEYLKWTDTGVVCKYHRHEGAYFYLEDDNSFRYALVNTVPATEADYNAYLQTLTS